MQLSSRLKSAVVLISAIFLVAIVGMVASTHYSTTLVKKASPLTTALNGIEANGLNATAVALADIYGEDIAAAVPVCPYETPEQISSMIDADVSGLNIPATGVPRTKNFLIMADHNGNLSMDGFDIDEVNLCMSKQRQAIPGFNLVPFIKDQQTGAWVLAQ